MGITIFRIIIVLLIGAAGYFFPVFKLDPRISAAIASILAVIGLVLEARVWKTQFKIVWGAALGALSGIILGWGLGAVYRSLAGDPATAVFLRAFFLVLVPAVGFLLGLRRPEWFNPAYLGRHFKEKSDGRQVKILDTSVIIDGRIADLCETSFIDGTLVVPQFVLKELQLVADSPDALKRQRGRRGLDILDHLQKCKDLSIVISETDFPEIHDVDSKLLELAKRLDAKIMTNDLNLEKIARLHGLSVLNVNELANALKPIVLPGEQMRVFLIKEGKEKDQGVAYLDDGTMVVVDNSRRWIGQNINITVTSVLQTTVGKMIFGRYNEEK